MLIRIMTGLVAAAIVLTVLALPQLFSVIALIILVALVWFLAIYELGRALKATIEGMLLVVTVNLAVSLIPLPAGGYLMYLFRDMPTTLPACFFDGAIGIAQIVLALPLLSAFTRGKDRILNYCWHSLVFLTLPACLLVFWSMLSLVNPLLIVIFFALAAANDTGALAAGKLFGSRKIVPGISPGKTIEGIVGGFAAMVTLLVLVHLILKSTIRGNGFMPLAHLDMALPLTWALLVVVCAWFALVGFLGDITFSAIKRNAGIKDFGAILPGHGGILDRIDSMLFIAPWYWFVLAVLSVANFR